MTEDKKPKYFESKLSCSKHEIPFRKNTDELGFGIGDWYCPGCMKGD